MQYVFFEKGKRSVQWGLGPLPQKLENFENFCVKINLTVCKVTFNCKLQKKTGEQDILVVRRPNNFVGGATAQGNCSLCSPGSRAYALALRTGSLGLGLKDPWSWPWTWPTTYCPRTSP